MLYEIIEKTNEWKLGDKTLERMWKKQGNSAKDIREALDETRDLRMFEYNRGVLFMAAGFFGVITIPYVKAWIKAFRAKRELKKLQESMKEENEEA